MPSFAIAQNMTSICAHRGASGYAPENTMAAFQAAIEMGASWIEFDVQLSADGEVIVLHDNTLARTTNLKGAWRPSDLTLPELKKLDAGSWFSPSFTGETIPTLDEVLEAFKGKLGMNIEIKSHLSIDSDSGLERKVADLLAKHHLFSYDEVIVSSFDPNCLVKLHAYNPTIPLGIIYSTEELVSQTFTETLLHPTFATMHAHHPDFRLIDAAFMQKARKQGLKINAWTVNESSDMQRMIELGVDMIITNYPDRLRKVVEELTTSSRHFIR